MSQELWNRLKQQPNASKSTLQIEAERNERERQRSLQCVKRQTTPVEREAAALRFRAITAMNAAETAIAENDIIAQREREIQQQIVEACKDVTSTVEQAEILRRAEPLLRRFATTLDDYSVTEWVGFQIQEIRARKEAERLAGV
jgi:hypothetical protein